MPKKAIRLQVLDQAIKDVKARESTYGDPLENHTRIAILWSAYESSKPEGSPVSPMDSVVFQILTNIARLIETPDHAPAWENIAGYAAIGAEVTK